VKRLAIIAALVAALAASRSIAVEPERIMDVTTWGAGDWFFAFIVVAWFLGDLTTGRANAVRGVIFAAALFIAFVSTGLWYWRLAIFVGIRLVANSVAGAFESKRI
jgi:hypothetical protein